MCVRTLHVCGHKEFIAVVSKAGDNIAVSMYGAVWCPPLNTQALTKDQLTLKLSVLFPAWSRERDRLYICTPVRVVYSSHHH